MTISPASSMDIHPTEEDIIVTPSAPPEPQPVIEETVVDSGVNTGRDNCQKEPISRRKKVGGAAVAGGVAGLVLAGPVVGLVAAGGAAVVATTKGTAGDVARATGGVAASAGTRLKQFDKKHKVVQKTSNGVVKGCNWVSKKLNGKKKEGT